jgi:hypothetical protein
LKKWEEKKAHFNMVHVDPHRNKNIDEEGDVWVITRGRVKTGRDFEHVECLGQKLEGNIRKVVQPHPKFNAT